jgi:hypothetical protein
VVEGGPLGGGRVPLDHGFFFASFLSFFRALFFLLSAWPRWLLLISDTHTPHHSAQTRLHLVFVAVAGVHKGMGTTNWWWLGAFFSASVAAFRDSLFHHPSLDFTGRLWLMDYGMAL